MMAQLGEWRGIKHGMKSAALAWRGMLEGTILSLIHISDPTRL